MKQFICIQSYDPYYGHSVIIPGREVFVNESEFNSNSFDFRLFNQAGHLIGLISREQFKRKFKGA